jgi:hypothetical protein
MCVRLLGSYDILCIKLSSQMFVLYNFSPYYFFQISCSKSWEHIHLMFVNSIILVYNYISLYLKTIWSHFFRLLLFKMQFTGKGYKMVVASRYTITISFGHSHRNYFYFWFVRPYKIAKTRFIFFGLNYFLLKQTIQTVYNSKPLNIFTLRGLRFRRQCIFKKTGKISLYF